MRGQPLVGQSWRIRLQVVITTNLRHMLVCRGRLAEPYDSACLRNGLVCVQTPSIITRLYSFDPFTGDPVHRVQANAHCVLGPAFGMAFSRRYDGECFIHDMQGTLVVLNDGTNKICWPQEPAYLGPSLQDVAEFGDVVIAPDYSWIAVRRSIAKCITVFCAASGRCTKTIPLDPKWCRWNRAPLRAAPDSSAVIAFGTVVAFATATPEVKIKAVYVWPVCALASVCTPVRVDVADAREIMSFGTVLWPPLCRSIDESNIKASSPTHVITWSLLESHYAIYSRAGTTVIPSGGIRWGSATLLERTALLALATEVMLWDLHTDTCVMRWPSLDILYSVSPNETMVLAVSNNWLDGTKVWETRFLPLPPRMQIVLALAARRQRARTGRPCGLPPEVLVRMGRL